MVALARLQHPALPDSRGQRKFDADRASAVFFKLPCLKLFDHDKMNAFPGSARHMQHKAGEKITWRDEWRL
jgi:hypothetical protein